MNTYLVEKDKSKCCGCAACEYACPTKAIKLEFDDEGFAFPIVDRSLCVDCNKCGSVCPIEVAKKNTGKKKAFGAYSKDGLNLKTSTSGGIFTEIAKKIISEGGYVCGCTIDDKHRVKHIVIDSVEELSLIKGSKYVQSNMEDIFPQVDKLLKTGKKLLFSGTPCQVSAIKNVFASPNLITIDLLCHGVPSQKLFDFYVEHLEKKYKGKLEEIVFRDKEKFGWSITQRYKIRKNNKVKTYYLERHTSEYFSGFLRNMTQRISCFSCPYTTLDRVGDITLADFWGVEKVRPELLNLNGTSLVLANSKRGEDILATIGQNIVIAEVGIDEATRQNINLISPPEKHKLRGTIYGLIFSLGFKVAGKKYLLPKNSYKYKIAQALNINVMKKSLTRGKMARARKDKVI